jgi:hypothetical protein
MAELDDDLFASESDEDSQSDDDDCGPVPVPGPPSPGRLDPAAGDRGTVTPAFTDYSSSRTDSSADHSCDCENRCDADSGPPPPRMPGLKEYNVRPNAARFVVNSLALLDDIVVESVLTGAQIPMKAFWYKDPVVVCFLRRFG